MSKIAVYRAIFNNWDNVLPIRYKVDHYLFTDNLKADKYKIITVDPGEHFRRANRKYKMQPFDFLPSYDYYIYLDGSIDILYSPRKLIKMFLKDCDIAVLKHPWRSCIYDEIEECINLGYIDTNKGRKQREFLINKGYPRRNGLTENGVILWRNTELNQRFGREWYKFYMHFTQRDQLSFGYIAWRMGVKYKAIEDNIRRKPVYFKYIEHKRG